MNTTKYRICHNNLRHRANRPDPGTRTLSELLAILAAEGATDVSVTADRVAADMGWGVAEMIAEPLSSTLRRTVGLSSLAALLSDGEWHERGKMVALVYSPMPHTEIVLGDGEVYDEDEVIERRSVVNYDAHAANSSLLRALSDLHDMGWTVECDAQKRWRLTCDPGTLVADLAKS